jgi:hypothetical protein
LLTQKKLPKILMLTAFITPGLMNRLWILTYVPELLQSKQLR